MLHARQRWIIFFLNVNIVQHFQLEEEATASLQLKFHVFVHVALGGVAQLAHGRTDGDFRASGHRVCPTISADWA
jgi:hypothetical protein